MKNKQDLLKILLGLLALLLSILGINLYQGQPHLSEFQEAKVEEVIDGDTIRVRDIENDEIFVVRYLGIDTPELEGPDYESCFGSQARVRKNPCRSLVNLASNLNFNYTPNAKNLLK